MGRPKNKPARKDGYFEYKGVVGQGIKRSDPQKLLFQNQQKRR